MPLTNGAAREHEDAPLRLSYWSAARRPLNILAFLGPLIIGYELCLALVLPAGDGARVHTVEAHKRLLEFFAAFEIAPAGGLFLGGLVIVVVLLLWHVLARDPWRIDAPVVGLMTVESALLALPLLVLGLLIARNVGPAAAVPGAMEGLSVWSMMAISVGAGLYEELVFRMLLIAVLHTLLVDAARLSHAAGALIAIGLSAAAFTWYHDLSAVGGGLSGQKMLFFFVAGLYFGLVYTLRGFGLVVGVHAAYDIMTVLIRSSADG